MKYSLTAIEKNFNFVMLLRKKTLQFLCKHSFIHIFEHLGLYKFYVCQYVTTKLEKVERLCFLLESEKCCIVLHNFRTTAQHTESGKPFKCKISIQ